MENERNQNIFNNNNNQNYIPSVRPNQLLEQPTAPHPVPVWQVRKFPYMFQQAGSSSSMVHSRPIAQTSSPYYRERPQQPYYFNNNNTQIPQPVQKPTNKASFKKPVGYPQTSEHKILDDKNCSCGLTFRRQFETVRHLYDCLPNELKPYQCDKCDRRFSRLAYIDTHKCHRRSTVSMEREKLVLLCQDIMKNSPQLPEYLKVLCEEILAKENKMSITNLLN